MHWIIPSDKDSGKAKLEKQLWDAAEQAGPALYPGIKSREYSGGRPQGPVLAKARIATSRLGAG